MPGESAPLLPEVRRVESGETGLLRRCGRSPALPDCPSDCAEGLRLEPLRERLLLLCRCGLSRCLPYCDGSHSPPASGWHARWRRFWHGD
ncbi:CDGSH iron-sulfur domain-containing protein [Pseudomonas lalucatii]|uniref:CDGSH iron-sulfur domain-containing protein n=1 Tax=Pseudomonas lalucatii TaxID=1424203 RepID=A0ABS5Q4R6_9PSED|nr:CDGSH iron-sulfur domain-containing protein [Pseudomonas lalucatii]MBS7663559.1 CDGSH iron-sulfur domain-containing protein [Pseudomonas lalucatii]MBS7689782.1 CDGSH iron-sulfur domain-containing protein [Pseudomonas lalucatii]MBS7725087.1 CDGSH iron-sulfur domain-containing protein [Pseudomonas lalucatii]QVM86947.1 CDGSH iron-sulfur domain-containing protein [Pseudomonas lalucatii]